MQIRSRIREAQKHVDPDPDPQHCFLRHEILAQNDLMSMAGISDVKLAAFRALLPPTILARLHASLHQKHQNFCIGENSKNLI